MVPSGEFLADRLSQFIVGFFFSFDKQDFNTIVCGMAATQFTASFWQWMNDRFMPFLWYMRPNRHTGTMVRKCLTGVSTT